MKYSKLFAVLLILNSVLLVHNSSAQCLQVESILVDACNNTPCPATATEGENEMVLFKVGSTPLTVGYMSTTATASLVPTWPNNSFKGWQTPGPLTNPLVAALNSTIIKCGYLLEPVGGILPANSQVLIVSSTNMCTAGNSFANLTDTLYVLFQIAGNTLGHFANNDNSGTITSVPTGSVSPRTFTLAYSGSVSCTESVVYDRSLLVNILGTYGGNAATNDGSTVEFDAAGVATYVNNGCQAPYIPIKVSATSPSTVCVNGTANLGGSISGPAVTYTWSTDGTGTLSPTTGTLTGTGSTTLSATYTPAVGESGTVSFTLTAQGKCALDVVTSTVSLNVIALPSPTVTSSNGAVICSGNNTVLSVNNEAGVSYTWNPGAANGTSFTVSPGSQTIYTATATNICASTDATFTVDVNTLPTVSVTSASVCPGFTATITASGASTYTWNTAATGSSISDAPATTTQYTASGTDVNGCVNTGIGTITVYNSPTVTVNSPAICIGGTATLTAGGASTFTWSTSQNGNSITDNPSTNTDYTVVGTDANGCDNFAVSSVTVNPLPTITVASQTICPGNTATLTAVGASTYTWSTTSNTSSITVAPASNTTYTVDGTDSNGCQNTTTASVTIVGSLTVSAVPASTVICSGSSTTITGSGAGTYTWSSANSLSSSTGTTVTASPTVSTTYTVVGSSGSCEDSTTVTVNVNNLPSVSGASTQSVVCEGTSITLTGSGASTYTWSGGANDGVAFTPVSTQTYVVSGTDLNGCVNSASVVVTVNPLPTVTVNSETICPGATATLTAVGASTYTWSTTSTNPSITVTPSSTTPYSVTATDLNGCQNTASATVSVVNTVTVSASPTNSVICNGSSTTITGNGATTYTWSSAGSLSSSTGTTVTASPTVATSYTVVGSSGACKDSTVVTINVNNLPTVNGAATQSVVCPGSSVTLTGSGASTYTWTGGVTDGVAFTPSSTQTYTVTGTDLNGCTNSANVTVTVNSFTITPASTATAICAGSPNNATLTASGASSYTWSPAGSLSSSTGSSVAASPTITTTYTVIGTNMNCLDSTTITLVVNTPPVITANTSTTSVCQGGSVTLTGGGGIFYNWTGGVFNGIPFNPTSTQTYTVIGVGANNCFGFAAITVTVNPLPVLTVNVGTVCLGQTATLNVAGANSYTWTPAATLSSSTGSSVIATPTTTTNYTVMGTDANGCVGQQITLVAVNSLPNISINPLNPSLCIGATTTLTAVPATGVTYTWSTTNVGNSISVNPLATTSYTVVGIDGNGCVNSQTTTVTVNPLPVITAASASVCTGSSATLLAAGASTYTWSNGQNGASITVPGTTGLYTVTGSSVNGCISTATASVFVFVPPMAGFTPDIYTGQVPATVVFTNTSTAGTGTMLTNYWNFGNGDTSFAVSPSETYSIPGTYEVLLITTDLYGCWDTATTTIVVTEVPVTIVVPNVFSPNGDNINDLFTITGTGIDKFNCKIYDRWGIFMYEWSDIQGGWNGKNVSNGKDVTDGTYYYILSYSDNKSKAFNRQGYLQLIR